MPDSSKGYDPDHDLQEMINLLGKVYSPEQRKQDPVNARLIEVDLQEILTRLILAAGVGLVESAVLVSLVEFLKSSVIRDTLIGEEIRESSN